MSRRILDLILLVAVFTFFVIKPIPAVAQGLPTIEDKTASMDVIDGYFPMYWDDTTGTLWLEISRFDTEELYLSGLSAGLGSNDIGLDRGELGASAVVRSGSEVIVKPTDGDSDMAEGTGPLRHGAAD